MPPYQTILIPTDFSEHSERGVRYAIDLAKKLGSKLHVVHSLHFPAEIPASSAWWEEMRAKTQEYLARAQEAASAEGIACETHLSQEPPVAAILDTADEIHADLIVMGSRGLTGLAHLLLGSTAERTLRMAKCPVLTLHDAPEDSAS